MAATGKENLGANVSCSGSLRRCRAMCRASRADAGAVRGNSLLDIHGPRRAGTSAGAGIDGAVCNSGDTALPLSYGRATKAGIDSMACLYPAKMGLPQLTY